MVAIYRRDPNTEVAVLDRFDTLEDVEAFLNEEPEVFNTGDCFPLDMWEHNDELVMRMELPGIKRNDIDISLEGNTLKVKAEKKAEEKLYDATYYNCERCFGNYSRDIDLPFPIVSDQISTSFEDGVLEIKVPKAEEAKAKHIAIPARSSRSQTSKSK